MAIVSEVKCGRCDRRYSGFRTRCPYCGARRKKRGKHADNTENQKIKIVIGILFIAVIIVAAMILMFSSLPAKPDNNPDESASPSASDSLGEPTDSEPSDSDGGDSDGEDASPDVSPSAEPTIVSVTTTVFGRENKDFTIKIGEQVKVSFATVPATQGKTATWKSGNEAYFTVTADGTVTGVGKGKAMLTVTVDGVSAECIVRVRP
jgi:cytoskeletal protein RodZ